MWLECSRQMATKAFEKLSRKKGQRRITWLKKVRISTCVSLFGWLPRLLMQLLAVSVQSFIVERSHDVKMNEWIHQTINTSCLIDRRISLNCMEARPSLRRIGCNSHTDQRHWHGVGKLKKKNKLG